MDTKQRVDAHQSWWLPENTSAFLEVLLDKEELNGYCQEAYGLQETLRINRSNWVVPIGKTWDFWVADEETRAMESCSNMWVGTCLAWSCKEKNRCLKMICWETLLVARLFFFSLATDSLFLFFPDLQMHLLQDQPVWAGLKFRLEKERAARQRTKSNALRRKAELQNCFISASHTIHGTKGVFTYIFRGF